MDKKKTGILIKEARIRKKYTQSELGDLLGVTNKAISRWENAKGYPDITLLEPIAGIFGVSITELISGNAISNANVQANMLRSKIYVCPVCGNVIHSMGEAVVNCHGILLCPIEPDVADNKHRIIIERAEDEYFVQIEHEMTKEHFISFIAAISSDRIQMHKLYPEGNAEARFKINGVEQIYFYCNKDGLFAIKVR